MFAGPQIYPKPAISSTPPISMLAGVGSGKLASVTNPYPMRSEAFRQLGDLYNRTRLTPTVKGLFAGWLRWSRQQLQSPPAKDFSRPGR